MDMNDQNLQYKSFIHPDEVPVPQERQQVPQSILARFSLRNKVAVVTGGAGAIGSAIVRGFAEAGGDIAIMDYKVSEKQTDEISKLYNVKVKSYQVDVSSEKDVKSTIDQIVRDFGTIDVFVANAGIAWNKGSILNENAKSEEWRRIFDVNVHGIYYCSRYVGEIFKRNRKGSLIMTASMSAHIVNVPNYQTCYNASKAAVLHMGKSLAIEFAGFARVNTISPGYTNTPLSDPVPTSERAKWWGLTPLGREAEPDELVGAFLYLASDASSFTSGSDIRVDGGYCSV